MTVRTTAGGDDGEWVQGRAGPRGAVDRRSLLALAAGAAGGLAGCSAVGPLGGGPRDGSADGDGSGGPAAGTGTPTPAPARPYASSDPAENVERSRALRVRNERRRSAYVTVLVEDGDRTVFLDSGTVPAAGSVTYRDLVRRRGIYRLTVETADGVRAVRRWVIGESWSVGAVVRVGTDGVRLDQRGVCDPACPPVASNGTAVDLPAREPRDAGRAVKAGIDVHNARPSTAPVAVTVAAGDRTLVDYRYRLPADATIHLPVTGAPGTYDLSVRSDGGRIDAAWHVPEEALPTIRLGPNGPAPACRNDRLGLTGVRNATDRERRVTVRIEADGRTVAARTFDLAATAERTDLGLRARGETFGVEAELASGPSLRAAWGLCPPGALRLLVIGPDLFLRTPERVVAVGRSRGGGSRGPAAHA